MTLAPPWQPISTAPRDGRPVALLWLEGDGYVLLRGAWRQGEWIDDQTQESVDIPIVGWVPLPPDHDQEATEAERSARITRDIAAR